MSEGFFSRSEMMKVRAPALSLAQCGACGLFKSCKSPKMPVSGRGRRGIMIVGEAPGAEEDDRGEPFVGKTGRHLERTLDDLGIDMRRDCWLTNAAVCRPEHNKLPDMAAEYCRPNLLRAVAEHRPDVIVLLGDAAVDSLIGHLWKENPGGVSRWTGTRIPSVQLNAWVCTTWHPFHLLREESPVLDAEFVRHLRAAVSLRGAPHPNGPPDYAARCDVVADPAEAARRINRIRDGVISFDYETDRLKPDHREAWLVCASVCHNGERAFAFPWTGPVPDAMAGLLGDPAVLKSGANISMEHGWTLCDLGVTVRGWAWDSVTGAHAADSRGLETTGLKYQAFTRLGVPDYAHHIRPFLEPREPGGNAVNRVREIDLATLLKYNAQDAMLEYHVGEHQRAELGYAI